MLEPGPRVAGADCVQFMQIANGALKPDRWRMFDADGRILAVAAGVSDDVDVATGLVEHGHFHVRWIGPQPKQRQAPAGQAIARLKPAIDVHGFVRQRHPKSLATFWKPVTSAGGI